MALRPYARVVPEYLLHELLLYALGVFPKVPPPNRQDSILTGYVSKMGANTHGYNFLPAPYRPNGTLTHWVYELYTMVHNVSCATTSHHVSPTLY